jgi:hypothetical protein
MAGIESAREADEEGRSMRGIEIGDAAMALLNQDAIDAYGGNGPTIWEATARIDHLMGTKAELLEAIAYVALQVSAYKRISNLDAHHAMLNVAHIVDEYKRRRHADT